MTIKDKNSLEYHLYQKSGSIEFSACQDRSDHDPIGVGSIFNEAAYIELERLEMKKNFSTH